MTLRAFPLYRCLAVVFLCGLFSDVAGAVAEESSVFYSGGRAHGLIRSDTEFVIEMEPGQTVASMGPRALDTAGGVLRPVPWGRSGGRFAILEVPEATPQVRRSARSMRGVRSVHRVYRFSPEGPVVLASGELVVRLSEGMSIEQRDAFFAEYGVRIVRRMDGLENVYILRPVDAETGDEVAIAAAMYEDGRTIWAHPNFRLPVAPRQATPQDTFFDRQWHLQNTGQEGGLAGADIGALDAWAETLGEDVLVSLFDDAVDVFHEDLRANYTNVSQDSSTGETGPDAANPQDIGDRHGTSVMGLLCAAPNVLGVRGSAPLARFTASRGLMELLTAAQQASVYTFARQQDVDVHNNSWGPVIPNAIPINDLLETALRTAFVEGRDGLGMVVLFASGNDDIEVLEGFEPSTLPTVIGVGATNAQDVRASYSNFGNEIDILAPSADDFLPALVTTDNTDDAGFAEPGYNNAGFDDDGNPDLPDPNYTKTFGGTSGACPVASGVAALILSANPNLTVTQVRLILEHTADKVAPADAAYNAITSRSFKYGYGRINAAAAVEAAVASRTNQGLTWPDRVGNVSVSDNTLSWSKNDDLRDRESTEDEEELGDLTVRTLVVQKAGDAFQWVPTDGEIYSLGQEVADGVTVVVYDDVQQYTFDDSGGQMLFFAIFAQNAIGRYSWGVAVDSEGNVTDPGTIDPGAGGGGGGDGDEIIVPPGAEIPKVSISVTPLSGPSPLDVSFRGNAQTDSEIVSTLWDFGDGATDTERTTVHTYSVPAGDSQTFRATFSVEDNEGDTGERSVLISVSASGDGGDAGAAGGGTLKVIIETPGAVGSDVDTGEAPFSVQLSVDTSDVPGTINSIEWDLGDGTQAFALSVPHTYTIPGTFPVTVTVTTITTSGATVTTTATRLITVTEGASAGDTDNDNGEALPPPTTVGGGSQGGTCGAGILIPFLGLSAMSLLRRRPA